jgi:hypothetical protein
MDCHCPCLRSTLGAGGFFGGNASASRFDTASIRIRNTQRYKAEASEAEKEHPLAPSHRAPCRQVTAPSARRCKWGQGGRGLVAPDTARRSRKSEGERRRGVPT